MGHRSITICGQFAPVSLYLGLDQVECITVFFAIIEVREGVIKLIFNGFVEVDVLLDQNHCHRHLAHEQDEGQTNKGKDHATAFPETTAAAQETDEGEQRPDQDHDERRRQDIAAQELHMVPVVDLHPDPGDHDKQS